jgi:hypothetical protein
LSSIAENDIRLANGSAYVATNEHSNSVVSVFRTVQFKVVRVPETHRPTTRTSLALGHRVVAHTGRGTVTCGVAPALASGTNVPYAVTAAAAAVGALANGIKISS